MAFVTDPGEVSRIEVAIREIVDGLDAAPVESPYDLLDLALVHAYLAGVAPDDRDLGGAALTRALEMFASGGGDVALYGGAARVGWTVAHLTDGEDADTVCAAIDSGMLRELSTEWKRDYDLIRGLVGIGVYALERGDAGSALATRVLDQLERLARPHGAGLAWHTAPELLPPHQRAIAAHGYWNLGLAHGQPGAIALLARYVARGIAAARPLLDGAMAYVLGLESYPAWFAGDEPSPCDRLAWCYGDLGISLALQSAAAACDDASWRARAIELARRCTQVPVDGGHVYDGGICHGAAGAAHCFHRMFDATGDAAFATATRTWLDRLFALRNAERIGGFPAMGTGDRADWVADPSILTGAGGVALVLNELISDGDHGWARLLLTDL